MSDDLTKIAGVGPATAEKLNARGITTFSQIADLTDDQITQLNEELELRDSITQKDWRTQAKSLAENPGQGVANDPKPAKASKSTQTVPVRIKRDIWDADGERHRKGAVIELPIEAAMDAIEAGAVSRVK